ncbi:hypothetical protein A8713_31750 [Streptomyces sp. SAT1]|uniref:hypothetical protein n=1 Tax=Streptomyces sp. SAT1 TaxID=1849967 RepID=UPI0007F9B2B4|nr:hypothetical protein [Streptomyces sp. SAT1]ANO41844.1 hypothetical protein A8713_31750 [Streptomyces sp. SAT1]
MSPAWTPPGRSTRCTSPGWVGLPVAAGLADQDRLTVPLADTAAAQDASATDHARGKIVIRVR